MRCDTAMPSLEPPRVPELRAGRQHHDSETDLAARWRDGPRRRKLLPVSREKDRPGSMLLTMLHDDRMDGEDLLGRDVDAHADPMDRGAPEGLQAREICK